MNPKTATRKRGPRPSGAEAVSINLKIPRSLVDVIDRKRGIGTRQAWIRWLIQGADQQ